MSPHPYATDAFARSLTHMGEALAVPAWSGHVLVRPIWTGGRDAVGPYPITVIPRDADLASGLACLRAAGLVSVVLVIEDHLRPPLDSLRDSFDRVRAFKTHYVLDRSLGPLEYGRNHRTKLRRALAKVSVAEIHLADHLDAWRGLYDHVSARHEFGALHVFPEAHHVTLAQLQGVRTFAAFVGEQMVSAHVFVTHEGHAISHLVASSPEGYQTEAAYAVNELAISELADCGLINFGGGAGLGDDPSDGLVRFKRGFSNRTAPSYLAGAILDPAAYEALTRGADGTDFFPAYRAPAAASPAAEPSSGSRLPLAPLGGCG